ncbi:hypothetical protein BDFB_013977, partial [Asbolus verrucosus]
MFNRKRIQYLKINTYTSSDTSLINEEAFLQSLTPLEKILSRKFKRIVTGGKGSKSVPILFSNRMQKFITCLITNTNSIKHNATILQLISTENNEMEQITTFMGHTKKKKKHAEFYRLPQDIYQTAEVATVLLLLEKGKGQQFKGKRLNDIELERNIYYSSESESEDDSIPLSERVLKHASASSSQNIAINEIVEYVEY